MSFLQSCIRPITKINNLIIPYEVIAIIGNRNQFIVEKLLLLTKKNTNEVINEINTTLKMKKMVDITGSNPLSAIVLPNVVSARQPIDSTCSSIRREMTGKVGYLTIEHLTLQFPRLLKLVTCRQRSHSNRKFCCCRLPKFGFHSTL